MIPFELSTEESALVRGGFFRRSRENKGKTNMKQLKFMLAAATAISLATAAQADQKFKDTFEGSDELPAGYSYVPVDDKDNDNESQIEAGGYDSDNALKVNTGTNPLLRALDWSGTLARPVPLSATKSVYIDTMVKFTLTPANDKPTPVAGDKLMIYVEEVPAVGETPASNKLVIWATSEDEDGNPVKTKCETTVAIDIDEWYHLYVESVAFDDGSDAYYPCFKVSLAKGNDTLVPINSSAALSVLAEFVEDPDMYFPSLAIADAQGGVTEANITYVGFAGEGKVDDLAFGTVETVTPVDFTLALGEGVSAVSYTVGNTSGKLPTAEGAVSVKLNGTSITLSGIEYAPGYEAGDVVAKSYQAADITVDAEKKTIVTEGETPTTGADIGFTGTPFADFAGADLQTVVAWAGAGHVPAATVQKMSFNNTGDPAGTVGSPERIAEEAYLLGCSPAEVEAKKEAFVFEAFDPTNPPTPEEFAGKGYNGEVVIEGATTLSDETTGKPNWATGHEKPAFYRARLKFK